MTPLTLKQYRAIRESLGSQTAVAKALGIQYTTLQRREYGQSPITIEMSLAILSLAQTMGRESRNEEGK